ncbi:hypothetical protein RRG08_002105 [Elysia crispata]|uniref:Uncharacterized protein n=1 Tax=Elysia crispata TaxID=231223 RepID=A0AAE0ZM72_9GAST|nr:hypothetical protein RRG08_002105 [Elysia crispata]
MGESPKPSTRGRQVLFCFDLWNSPQNRDPTMSPLTCGSTLVTYIRNEPWEDPFCSTDWKYRRRLLSSDS